jgi:hypothetical protein
MNFKRLLSMALAFAVASFGGEIVLESALPKAKSFEKQADGALVRIQLDKLDAESLNLNQGDYTTIKAEGLISGAIVGNPDLPVYSRLLEIPQGAEPKYKVVSFDTEIIDLSANGYSGKVVPRQAESAKLPGAKRPAFAKNAKAYETSPKALEPNVSLTIEGQMRSLRLARIQIDPIVYDAPNNRLIVFNNVVVEISFPGADKAKTALLKEKYATPYLANTIDEEGKAAFDSKGLIMDAPPTYAIVADRMFESTLAPFIAWKKKQGYFVIVEYTDNIGATTTAIQTYLKGLYNSPGAGVNPTSFVLLVGDVAQIPAFSGVFTSENGGDAYYTDLHYADYTSDYIPDVLIGRFSAETTTQLAAQVNKTMTYEQYGMADPSYLGKALLVGGVDANYADAYANSVMDYLANYYITSTEGYSTTYSYLYGDAANSTVMNSDASGASASVVSKVSEGVGFGIYSAHCYSEGWYEPGFYRSHISGLSNTDKYGLLIGNCCQSNVFYGNTFGEDIVRAENKGAVAYIGSAALTYWSEDYWWATGLKTATRNPSYDASNLGMFDRLFHTHGETSDEWATTVAQILQSGNLIVQASTSSRKSYYWENYHTMGDPSLEPYMGVPSSMSISGLAGVLPSGGTLNLNVAPYAYVALTQNGVLYGSGRAGATGAIALDYSGGLTSGQTADIVITAQNYEPYVGTLAVAAATEPFIGISSFVSDADLVSSSTQTISLVLENLAESYSASGVNVAISTTTPGASINDASEAVGTISGGASVSLNSAFDVTIDDSFTNGDLVVIDVVITDGEGRTWEYAQELEVVASDFVYVDYSIEGDLANGVVEPGFEYTLTVNLVNNGISGAVDVSLSSGDASLVVMSGAQSLSAFTGANTAQFTIAIPSATNIGSYPLDIVLSSSGREISRNSEMISVGELLISDQDTLVSCNALIFDTGGEEDTYGIDEVQSLAIIPQSGSTLRLEMLSLGIEATYDNLSVYNSSGSLLSSVDGFDSTAFGVNGVLSASGADQSLTLEFNSDYSINESGFAIRVTCPDWVVDNAPVVKMRSIDLKLNASLLQVNGAQSVQVFSLDGALQQELHSNGGLLNVELQQGTSVVRACDENSCLSNLFVVQ